MRPAVFLDRDGTINREVNYLSKAEDFELLPGAGKALRRLADAGYLLIVVTNQSGLSRGYFTEADLDAIHQNVTLVDAEFLGRAVIRGLTCRERAYTAQYRDPSNPSAPCRRRRCGVHRCHLSAPLLVLAIRRR